MAEMINRVHRSLQDFLDMEESNADLFNKVSNNVMSSSDFAKLRLNYLNKVAAKLSFTSLKQERDSLAILRITRKQLVSVAYPKNEGFKRTLYQIVQPLKAIIQKQFALRQQKKQLVKIRKLMQRAGFSGYFKQVVSKIRQGEREFSLSTPVKVEGNDLFHFNLRFSFDHDKGHYFDNYLTSYRNSKLLGVLKTHCFDMNEGVVSQEWAEKLIAGRAILESYHDNGGISHRWVKFDTIKDEKGNFLLKHFPGDVHQVTKSCEAIPIWSKLSPIVQHTVINSLLSGERTIVDIEFQGRPLILSIQYDPEARLINAVNQQGKRFDIEKLSAVPKEVAIAKQEGVQNEPLQFVRTPQSWHSDAQTRSAVTPNRRKDTSKQPTKKKSRQPRKKGSKI